MQSGYGIKHKKTGLYFGGFSTDCTPKWVVEAQAVQMTECVAEAQAILLRREDAGVQKKPVNL